jgi:hypothetical protein
MKPFSLTLADLKDTLDDLLPGCDFDLDENGQVIIYTNRIEDDDGELIDVDDIDGGFDLLEDEQ